jgi:hypothetical protein
MRIRQLWRWECRVGVNGESAWAAAEGQELRSRWTPGSEAAKEPQGERGGGGFVSRISKRAEHCGTFWKVWERGVVGLFCAFRGARNIVGHSGRLRSAGVVGLFCAGAMGGVVWRGLAPGAETILIRGDWMERRFVSRRRVVLRWSTPNAVGRQRRCDRGIFCGWGTVFGCQRALRMRFIIYLTFGRFVKRKLLKLGAVHVGSVGGTWQGRGRPGWWPALPSFRPHS